MYSQAPEQISSYRFRVPVLLASALALVRPQIVEDAGLLEEESALGALLVRVKGVRPLEAHPHLRIRGPTFVGTASHSKAHHGTRRHEQDQTTG